MLGCHRVLSSFLVLSCLSRDSTSAGEVVMVCKVEVISGVVRIGGVVGGGGGLSATECSLCWMKKRLSILGPVSEIGRYVQ